MSTKENFKNWLQTRVDTLVPLSSYPNALSRLIPDKLTSINENIYGDLFDCSNLEYLKTLYKRLSSGGDLNQYNAETQNRVSSAAVGKYIEYLESLIVNTKIEKCNYIKTKNIMLYGVPGVGKTYNYKKLVALIEGGDFEENEIFDFIINNKDDEIEEGSVDKLYNIVKSENRLEFVTFHQSYSYEDFIEGFRPNEDKNIKLEDGIFKKLCQNALENKQKNFYIVIDEINRGNISKIFGELITLIEEDKRDNYEVTLPYSKEKFKIPSNLYIIATMNSTDKSIATIDIALRRRFTFLKMKPQESLVQDKKAKELFINLNTFIEETLGEDYKLGHSYFMQGLDLDFVKEYKIKPLLEEYFYGDDENYKKTKNILNSVTEEKE